MDISGRRFVSCLFYIEREGDAKEMEYHDLNTLVATEVMEYKRQKFKGQDGFGTSNGLVFFSHFNPVNEIKDAWKVLEKLKDNKIKSKIEDTGNKYVVELRHEHAHGICENKKVEVAICNAALSVTRMLKTEGGTQEHG